MTHLGRSYKDVRRGIRIGVGDRLRVMRVENGMRSVLLTEVAEVYEHHVVLDFGKYRESRRIVDIELGISDVIG